MHPTREWPEVLERMYARRNELADRLGLPHGKQGQPGAQAASPGLPLAPFDQVLRNVESGLYPRCDRCGERIEMDRLRKDPLVTTCWACAARLAKASQAA